MQDEVATAFVWVDGCRSAVAPVDDRALHYGDGIFTTALVAHGQVVMMDAHLARLQRDAVTLKLPAIPVQLIRSELEEAARVLGAGVLKYIVTRGSGPRGYAPPPNPLLRRMLFAAAAPTLPASCWTEGISLHSCQLRMSGNSPVAGAKHLNRLEQVLARLELADTGCIEGLLLDHTGAVIGGTMTNLFFVAKDVLFTPEVVCAGVAGLIRGEILSLAAQMGISCQQGRYTLSQLLAADEAFVTNAVIGLWPVVRWGACRWPVGTMTRRIAGKLQHPKAGLIGL